MDQQLRGAGKKLLNGRTDGGFCARTPGIRGEGHGTLYRFPYGNGGRGGGSGGNLRGRSCSANCPRTTYGTAAESEAEAERRPAYGAQDPGSQPPKCEQSGPQTRQSDRACADAAHRQESCGEAPQGQNTGGHVADGDDPPSPVEAVASHVDMDQGQAEEGGPALVLIVEAGHIYSLYSSPGMSIGRSIALRFLPQNEIVEAHRKALSQGGEVVQIGAGGPRFP